VGGNASNWDFNDGGKSSSIAADVFDSLFALLAVAISSWPAEDA
jgi:hypothetical protein